MDSEIAFVTPISMPVCLLSSGPTDLLNSCSTFCYIVSHPEVLIDIGERPILKFDSVFKIVLSDVGNRLCQDINVFRKLTKEHGRVENALFFFFTFETRQRFTTVLFSSLLFIYLFI